jgi:phospholipid/cholesterol/gamma-HCH transport system permease protein
MAASETSSPSASWKSGSGGTILELAGDWKSGGPVPEVTGDEPDGLPAGYETSKLGRFDSTLPAFLFAHFKKHVQPPGDDSEPKPPQLDGLPDDLRGLMELALGVPERSDAKTRSTNDSDIKKLGKISIDIAKGIGCLADFIGQSLLSLGRFFTGRAQFRFRDFWLVVQQTGAEALPIVSLISFLIGAILAFVGNVQLTSFGANIYVADLVGIAMVREMGVVMTAIIMSGRTGAAFAANIGSMKANEEIDALRTFGFDPFDFLVLPRLLALVIMMPILTLYANVVGILGGMVVGAAVGIPPILYWTETLTAVTLTTASLGFFKSFFFGAAIAISGCLQGMRAGNSSAAVGEATTKAVVASITTVIILDSAFAAIFTVMGI